MNADARSKFPAILPHRGDPTAHLRGDAILAGRRVILVDLNRFTRFPTLAVGILAAALRARGCAVRVICPLALDVPAADRERAEGLWDHLHRRIRLSDVPAVTWLRDRARAPREWLAQRPRAVVMRAVERALAEGADAVLMSAYLEHFHTVAGIGRVAARAGVPVLLGGPMFNLPGVADTWRTLPGVAAVVGGEVEFHLAEMVAALAAGQSLARFPGVTLPDGTRSAPAAPLRPLDAALFPDFDDFPWDRYPARIVPILAGRGCQWDRCTFCSDVISASGRSFRSRTLDSVLVEMEVQADRYGTRDFMFLDLKLNSHPGLFRGLAREVPRHLRGGNGSGRSTWTSAATTACPAATCSPPPPGGCGGSASGWKAAASACSMRCARAARSRATRPS